MACVNYTIATYPGKLNSRIFQENSEYVLSIQIEHLKRIFTKRIENKIPNLIKQITVVKTKPRDNNFYEKYYDISKYSDVCGVPIVFLEYYGDNMNHSYDQWLQSFEKYKDIEYHLFIEDDYCIDDNNITFDIELVDLYNNYFPDKYGYLCSLQNFENNILTNISNGMIHNTNLNKISLDLFYNNPLAFYTNYRNPQIQFIQMFLDLKLPVKGMNNIYKTLFWSTTFKKLLDYTDGNNTTKSNFIPVQSSLICNDFLKSINQ